MNSPSHNPLIFFGGAERDRTVDLLTASQALSQLSYSPTYKIKPKIPISKSEIDSEFKYQDSERDIYKIFIMRHPQASTPILQSAAA